MNDQSDGSGERIAGYARHVGRVGALAVALGIGTAVITTPGMAWADDDTTTHVDGTTVNENAGSGPTEHQAPESLVGSTADQTSGQRVSGGTGKGAGSGTSIGVSEGPKVFLNVMVITARPRASI